MQNLPQNGPEAVATGVSAGHATKERILDAAERLFAEHGVGATSLRSITKEAGANLAAVNYHFGGKEPLIAAVFGRRFEPVNRERLRQLAELEAAGETKLEELLRAFIRPALLLCKDPAADAFLQRLFGRLHTEPNDRIRELVLEQFQEMAGRYIPAFQKTCPHLTPAELLWRIHFMAGALAHTLADLFDLKTYSKGLCDPHDLDATTNNLVHFAAAGMRAPALTTTEHPPPPEHPKPEQE